MVKNEKAQELDDLELEQTAGGANLAPGDYCGTAIYTGHGSDFYIDGPALEPTAGFEIPAAPTIPTGGTNYCVQHGDTLGKIAKNKHTTIASLLALNPQITDENKIFVGQTIRIA
jgi:nucleoid-associated protein YgaU